MCTAWQRHTRLVLRSVILSLGIKAKFFGLDKLEILALMLKAWLRGVLDM